MPSLEQILALRDKYGNSNNLTKSLNRGLIRKAFLLENLEESFRGFDDTLTNNFEEFFDNREKANVVLLFIDITNFSTKFSNTSNVDLIGSFLDEYYDETIPIIYKHGGEIEKIIGDGIVSVFGKPFLNNPLDELIERAEDCSQEIIKKHFGSNKESKIALHSGNVMYYKNNSLEYFDYTIIGHTLIELFRLESISNNNSINFYSPSAYENQLMEVIERGNKIRQNSKIIIKPTWIKSAPENISLKGCRFNKFSYLEYQP